MDDDKQQDIRSFRESSKLLFGEWGGMFNVLRQAIDDKPLYRYYAVIFPICLVTIAAVIFLDASPHPDWLEGLLVVIMTAVYLIHLLNNQNSLEGAKGSVSRFVKIALEVFIASAVAYFFYDIGALGDKQPGGGDFMIAFVVAITLVSLQIVAGIAGFTESLNALFDLVKRLNGAVASIENAAEKSAKNVEVISNTVNEVKDVALLAARLKLEEVLLNNDSGAIRSAIGSALGTTDYWVKTGKRLVINDIPTAQSESWWRLMETYNREERYDIARNEIVTNVRNYAFLILRLIDEHIAVVNKNNNGQRVVVAQVTPFAPKDFYNFPNGSGNNRYYFDQEFFGTYRRLLSHYLRHSKVEVRRVMLCGQSTENENRDLGWKLDDPLKLYLGCKYMNLLPTAVPVTVSNGKSEKTTGPDSLLAKQFSRHDPAKRLRGDVESYPWVPVYPIATWQYISIPSSFENGRDVLWRKLNNREEIQSVSVDNGCLISKEGISATDLTGAELTDLKQMVKDMVNSTWENLTSKVNKVNNKSGQLKNKFEDLKETKVNYQETLKPREKVNKDKNLSMLFMIVPIVQEIDALLAPWCEMEKSASGQPMGIAEIWLYWWLVEIEQEKNIKRSQTKLPLIWERFKSDVLAIDDHNDDDVEKIKKHLRLVPLHSRQDGGAEDNQRDFAHIERKGILPEFVLIGLAKDENTQMKDVEWKVFFGSEMSEPFHAARIQFDFGGSNDGANGLLNKHKDWLTGLWGEEKGDQVTVSFIDAMEAGDDGCLKEFLDTVDNMP